MRILAACLLTVCTALVGGAQDSGLATAENAARGGDCKAAIKITEGVLREKPRSGEGAYQLLAACQARLGRPADAARGLREGLRLYPASAVLEKALGQALYLQRPEDPEAGERLVRSVKALPRDPEARHYYAQWAYLNQKDNLCIQQEEAALALSGLNDLALLQMYTLLGMCRSRLPDAGATRAAFRKANATNLRTASYDPVPAYQFLQFLGRLGDFEEQQSIVNEILTHAPQFGPGHLEKAKHFERNRRPTEAIESASLALRSGNMDLNQKRAARMILAKCHLTLGNTKEAEAEQRWIEAHSNPETPRK